MNKKIVSVLLVAAMAFGMTACGSSENAESGKESGGGDVGGNVGENSGGSVVNVYVGSDLEGTLDAEIEAYRAVNPDVEIVKHVIPNNDYDDKIKVLLSGGADDVDVFWARTPAFTNQYRTAGALEDLSPYMDQSDVNMESIATELQAVSDENGGVYGLPIYSSCWMLFYNKALFDKAGAAYPTGQMTWDEYCELAESLTNKEGDTQYWGGVCPSWTMNLGAIAAGEYLTGEKPLEKTKEYLEITERMYAKGHISIEEMNNGSWDLNSCFANGNVYMMIDGDWGYRDLNCDFEYGTAPLPVMDGVEEKTSVGNACYYCMAKTATNKQAAYDFMEFATTSDEGTSVTARTGNVPSYTTEAAMEAYKESVQIEGIDNRFEMTVLPEQSNADNYAAIYEVFKQEAQLYLLGEESIDECMENFYKLREETE